jgi:hypothetical protein
MDVEQRMDSREEGAAAARAMVSAEEVRVRAHQHGRAERHIDIHHVCIPVHHRQHRKETRTNSDIRMQRFKQTLDSETPCRGDSEDDRADAISVGKTWMAWRVILRRVEFDRVRRRGGDDDGGGGERALRRIDTDRTQA